MQIRLTMLMILVLIILPLLIHTDIQAQTKLKSGTFTMAGGTTASDSYTMVSIIGQTIAPAGTSGSSYEVQGYLRALTMDLELPNLSHTPPASPQQAGQDISIQVTATDNINVDACILYYREGGIRTFTSLNMTPADNIFSGSIPGSSVGASGVEYYLRVEDVNGNFVESGLYDIRVALGGTGITNSSAQPAGSAQNAYRMISLPLDATSKNPTDVLEEELGTYNKTKWRFFSLRSDQTYAEHPDAGTMTPGKAFWLIVKESGKTIKTGPGNTVQTGADYTIPLAAGWTLVGNPYNFSVPQGNISMQNDSTLDIRSYNGNWQTFQGSLSPFQGYAVYSETATNLLINPDLSAAGKIGVPKMPADKEKKGWTIDILAQCQDAQDSDTKAITHSAASIHFDGMDKPEPPQIGEYVSVYFPHPEWGKISKHYCRDVRPQPTDGEIWEFEIRTNINDAVALTFNGIETVPREYALWLIDEHAKSVHDLRDQASYTVNVGTNQPKKLMLAVGKPDFLEDKLNSYKMIPTAFCLDQNFPNPFNPVTTIRFGLPIDENVSLKVYNLLGQEVTTLLNNVARKAGYHTVQWDGRNQQGRIIASGLYIYRIQAGTFSSIRKMILVR